MSDGDMSPMNIAPAGAARRLVRRLGFALLFVAAASLFAWLFFLLTTNWKVAIGSVTLFVGAILLMGWLAERQWNGREDSMR